jgi:hypothetical protein
MAMPKREVGYFAVAEDPENGSSRLQDSPHPNVKLVLDNVGEHDHPQLEHDHKRSRPPPRECPSAVFSQQFAAD